MFKLRMIGFFLLMSLLAGIFFWRPWGEYLFLAAAPLICALAVYECARMLNNSGRENFPRLTALAFYIFVLMFLIFESNMMICVSAFAGCALFLTKREDLMKRLLNSAGIFLLLTPALSMLLYSFYVTDGGAAEGIWLLFLCLVTKATDTGGYIVGSLTAKLPGGNRKIAPSLSPKKSWEGLIGGMVLSVAVSLCFFKFSGISGFHPVWFILSGVILSLGSFFGDLAESAIKRMCCVKDSGHWMPGMGGALDVVDSFIFNGILFYALLYFNGLAAALDICCCK